MHFLIPMVLGGALMGQDPATVRFQPNPKVGDTTAYSTTMKFEVMGNEASIKADVMRKVTALEEGKVTLSLQFSNDVVEVGGQTMQSDFEPMTIVQDSFGKLFKLSGGIAELDSTRLYLITNPVLLSVELTEGKEFQYEVEGDQKIDIPKLLVSGKYLGREDVGGISAHKLELKTKEDVKTQGFEVEGSYWVADDGGLLKSNVDFKNLYVYIAQQYISGKLELQRKPK